MVYHDLIILLHFTIDYAFEVLLHLLYLCDGNTIYHGVLYISSQCHIRQQHIGSLKSARARVFIREKWRNATN